MPTTLKAKKIPAIFGLKSTVKLRGITPEMAIGHTFVMDTYNRLGYTCLITSANDSQHGRASLHFVGNALDYRTKHVARDELDILATTVKSALGAEFDVVLEKRGQPLEHLHVEYQPKR